jgi:hypothetical protein
MTGKDRRLDFIIDHRVSRVCEYWKSLLRNAAPPERRQIEPGRIKETLPYVWIAEMEGADPLRFCMRLAGEEVNRLFGKSLRRQYIDEIFPSPVAGEVTRKLERVIETPALFWTFGPFFESSPGGPGGECAVMPLLVEGARRAALGVTVPNSAITDPPRRLYPICQRKEIVEVSDLAPAPV